MKKIMLLLTTCMLCVACQQYNDVEEYMLRGYWQEADRPNYYYLFSGESKFVIYNVRKSDDVCAKGFTYQIYDKQMITSAYYKISDNPSFIYSFIHARTSGMSRGTSPSACLSSFVSN